MTLLEIFRALLSLAEDDLLECRRVLLLLTASQLLAVRKQLQLYPELQLEGFFAASGSLPVKTLPELRAELLTPEQQDTVLVSLDQIALMANRAKKTLEKYKAEGKMPKPDVTGGRGRAHKWRLGKIKVWLVEMFGEDCRLDLPFGRLG